MKVWIPMAAWVLVSLSAGLVGSQFTPGEWFDGLEKPSWNPPHGCVRAGVDRPLHTHGVAAWMV